MRQRRFWIAAKSESGKPSIHLQCCFPISLSSSASSWWYWWLHQCPRGPHCSIYWILEAAIDLFNYLYIFPFLQHCTEQISATRNAAAVVMRQFFTKKLKTVLFLFFQKLFSFFGAFFIFTDLILLIWSIDLICKLSVNNLMWRETFWHFSNKFNSGMKSDCLDQTYDRD